MNIKKVCAYIIVGLLISILGITTADALNTESGIWHSSDKISVIKQDCPLPWCLWESNWVNTPVTLEDITPLKLGISWTINLLDYKDAEPIIGGHNASQIWVKVRPTLVNNFQEEMTLLKALKSAWGLCPPNDITNTYSGPTDKTQAYHYGTEVEVTIDGITTSLQDAINGGTFCWNYYWATSSWVDAAGCGTLTHTRTVNCVQSDTGARVDESKCTETKPATSEAYFHQCYLHRLSWGNRGCAGIACCCPFGQATIGAYASWTTCSSYGSHYYAYKDTGCFVFYGSCDWEDWSCY